MAFSIQGSQRVALSSSANAARRWRVARSDQYLRRCKAPAIFCLQNNPTASRRRARQLGDALFADKAAGYGIPGLTIDGTDPDEVAAAFTWAAERARAGEGPALIEVIAMRMCGHAHHDDMLYLGKDQPPSWEYHQLHESGYANRELYEFWAKRDPIPMYARRLEDDGVIRAGHLDEVKKWADELVDRQAQLVIQEAWPKPENAAGSVFKDESPRTRVELLEPSRRLAQPPAAELPPLEPGLPFDKKGNTLLEAVMLGVDDALKADPRVFVYGQDVGGQYGNAFLLLRPLLKDYGDRIRNSPLAEGAVLGVCVGAALAGLRPIGEMQFNDFVATGFNQLVNTREDPVSLGRGSADGGAHAVGWPAVRRPVSQPEHRAVVLPHAGPEDRGALDTGGCAIVDGRRRGRSGSRAVLRAHRALPRSPHQAAPAHRRTRANADR